MTSRCVRKQKQVSGILHRDFIINPPGRSTFSLDQYTFSKRFPLYKGAIVIVVAAAVVVLSSPGPPPKNTYNKCPAEAQDTPVGSWKNLRSWYRLLAYGYQTFWQKNAQGVPPKNAAREERSAALSGSEVSESKDIHTYHEWSTIGMCCSISWFSKKVYRYAENT